ncbi:MAG: hypothetical protein ACR2RE_16070 [Geminicoccaceae bacterium]
MPSADLLKLAIMLHPLAGFIAKGRQNRADDQNNEENTMQPIARFLLDRLADTTMDALAKVRGQRLVTKPATSKLHVGTRHQYPLDIAELLIVGARDGSGRGWHDHMKKQH